MDYHCSVSYGLSSVFMEPGRDNPQSTAPPLAPAWNSSFYTAEGAHEGGFRQIFTCSSRSSVLNPRKFSNGCFLQISTSFWTTWIVVFKQEAQMYFKGGGRNLTAAEECPPCLWGLRGTETLFHLGACLWSEVSDGWLDYMIYTVSSNFDDSVKFQLLSSDHFEASA